MMTERRTRVIIDRKAPSVLIVDDDPCFREIARELLSTGGFEVLGEAGSAAEALSAVDDLRPEVVLLDVQLPDGDGFGIARLLTNGGEGPRVVLCSVRAAQDYSLSPERCGAAGFVTKSALTAQALRRLVDGHSPP